MEDVSHDQNDQSCVCFGPRVVSTGDPACAHSEPDSMTTMSVKHVGRACTASMAFAFVPPLDVTWFGAQRVLLTASASGNARLLQTLVPVFAAMRCCALIRNATVLPPIALRPWAERVLDLKDLSCRRPRRTGNVVPMVDPWSNRST